MPIGSPELNDLVQKVVTDRGFDLEDVVVRRRDGRDEFSVVVDRDGGSDLDVLAELSTEIGEVLDAVPALADAAYTLEVTSPGIDRPLTAPRHWRRALGRRVRIERDGSDAVVGRVGQVSGDDVAIVVNHKGRLAVETVGFDSVTRAVVQVEFSRPSVAELEMCGLGPDEIAARRADAER